MRFRSAETADLATMAALAAPLQSRPERHVVYLATERAGIEADLAEATWESVSVVALRDGRGNETMAGWLIGDVDDELGRVWWFGPFVCDEQWQSLASDLLFEARRRLPPGVDQEEMAVDARFEGFEPWANDAGFLAGVGAWVLTLERALDDPDVEGDAVRTMLEADGDAVASLHDELFPGTHTTGRHLVEQQDDRHPRLVAVSDGMVTGYVAVERQPDGSGYIDFLGVDPGARRRGLGRALVRAGVAALDAIDADPIHLTVREDSDGARELYASLGFTEERLARSFRSGFHLA